MSLFVLLVLFRGSENIRLEGGGVSLFVLLVLFRGSKKHSLGGRCGVHVCSLDKTLRNCVGTHHPIRWESVRMDRNLKNCVGTHHPIRWESMKMDKILRNCFRTHRFRR